MKKVDNVSSIDTQEFLQTMRRVLSGRVTLQIYRTINTKEAAQ